MIRGIALPRSRPAHQFRAHSFENLYSSEAELTATARITFARLQVRAHEASAL